VKPPLCCTWRCAYAVTHVVTLTIKTAVRIVGFIALLVIVGTFLHTTVLASTDAAHGLLGITGNAAIVAEEAGIMSGMSGAAEMVTHHLGLHHRWSQFPSPVPLTQRFVLLADSGEAGVGGGIDGGGGNEHFTWDLFTSSHADAASAQSTAAAILAESCDETSNMMAGHVLRSPPPRRWAGFFGHANFPLLTYIQNLMMPVQPAFGEMYRLRDADVAAAAAAAAAAADAAATRTTERYKTVKRKANARSSTNTTVTRAVADLSSSPGGAMTQVHLRTFMQFVCRRHGTGAMLPVVAPLVGTIHGQKVIRMKRLRLYVIIGRVPAMVEDSDSEGDGSCGGRTGRTGEGGLGQGGSDISGLPGDSLLIVRIYQHACSDSNKLQENESAK
jgi:hypothetical protein